MHELLRRAECDGLPASALVSSSSHSVFRIEVDGKDVACKVFLLKHGDEVDREWAGLSLVAERAPGLAATPLARAKNAIVMSWCPGRPVNGPSGLLAEALTRLYSIVPPIDMPLARTSPSVALSNVRRWRDAVRDADVPPEADAWLVGPEAQDLRETPVTSFVRSDGKLDNILLSDEQLMLVDFEDCGRGDWVCDVADLVEHAHSRGVNDRDWLKFFDSFDPLPEERLRFRSARLLFAIGWMMVFLKRGDFRAGSQRARVESMFRSVARP